VEWADLEAEHRKAPLRIVSVPNMLPHMHAERGPVPTVATELREFSERAIDAAVLRSKEIAPGLVVIDTALLTGAPAVVIADTGKQALMIVVGARGAGGFTAMLLGSVSRYVGMHAVCPVVVIREQTDAAHREIVVGVHDMNESTQALAFGFEQAALCGAELVAVHALHRSEERADQEATLAQASHSLGESLAGWKDRYPGVAVRPDVVRAHPAQVLSEYSARADLVVIGRHGGSSRPAVGSIQHAVLHHARGPVAIVPSGN
jgi:nucleotide-binding universal stress UspA family protein